ncbi:MAG: hypothetical protein HYW02_01350 [Deltaproteobacteria bacterium]|nr:hypothetical protein [Deltaproteobacteria bacterium]
MKGLILPLGVFATGILASACCGEPEPQKKEPPSSNCNNDPKITMVGFDCHRDMDGGSVRLLLQRSPLYSRATSMRVSFDAYSGERFSNVSLSRLDMAVVIDGI